ncbi:unnamed protein product [Rhizophagus irregularis]|nr:unnamed protein product [Rhizophagus irregularis]
MIKALESGYDPPSRRVLSGTLLEAELSKVNARVNNELEKESNFTIDTSKIQPLPALGLKKRLMQKILQVLDNHERKISNEVVKAILKKEELDAQLRAYFDNSEPYNTSYSVHDTAYYWWNSIVDGKFSSLS